MLQLKDSIEVHCSVDHLYGVISDVERHASLLPGYIESRIVERRSEGAVVQREAMIHGRRRRWLSLVHWEPNVGLHFEQLEGPLQGMRIQWLIAPATQGASLCIRHDVHVRPWWKRWWMERWVAKPAIEKTARLVLKAIKSVAEKKEDRL